VQLSEKGSVVGSRRPKRKGRADCAQIADASAGNSAATVSCEEAHGVSARRGKFRARSEATRGVVVCPHGDKMFSCKLWRRPPFVVRALTARAKSKRTDWTSSTGPDFMAGSWQMSDKKTEPL